MKEELFESILSEADKSYKAKVGGKWLKGNGFTDKEKNADTFESKTEPTQRINQMKKDGKISKNAKVSTKEISESQKELFDNVLREAGRRISSYSDIELALEFIGQYCAVFDVGKMGYSSNPRASKLAEACSERFGDKWDNDYYGNGPSMEKLLVNKFDEMNKANDCGNSIGAIYKAANMTWGPYKDWVMENWRDIVSLSPKFAKYYDNTNFF